MFYCNIHVITAFPSTKLIPSHDQISLDYFDLSCNEITIFLISVMINIDIGQLGMANLINDNCMAALINGTVGTVMKISKFSVP